MEFHVTLSNVVAPLLFVVIHDPDFIIPNPNHAGGSRVLIIKNPNFLHENEYHSCGFLFEISRKRIEKFSTSKKKCEETNDSKFSQCIERYMSNQLDCRLPWMEESNGMIRLNNYKDQNYWSLIFHTNRKQVDQLDSTMQ